MSAKRVVYQPGKQRACEYVRLLDLLGHGAGKFTHPASSMSWSIENPPELMSSLSRAVALFADRV